MRVHAAKPETTARAAAWSVFASAMLALIVCATTTYGIVKAYSSVPCYDAWDGSINFYRQVTDGNFIAWWAPHNEHRVVLPRLLLWADLHWLGGTDVMPLVVDALAVVGAAWTFWKMSLANRPGIVRSRHAAFGLCVLAWLALWMQKENLTSGFQSGFLLAFCVPLWAFRLLDEASRGPRLRFVGACVLGVAAAGTMINGVITLPLMTLQALLTSQSWRRCLILSGLSVVIATAYFYGLAVTAEHLHRSRWGLDDLVSVIQYTVYYLGSPAHFLLKEGIVGRFGAATAGSMLIVLAVVAAVRNARSRQPDDTAFALLIFILYVMVAALLTAWGRIGFGVDQAFSSRYTTPALMAWAALFALYRRSSTAPLARWKHGARIVAVLLALLMIRLQTEATKPQDVARFGQKLGALALALQVNDAEAIHRIYPRAQRALEIAAAASARNLSVFNRFPWKGASTAIGGLDQAPPASVRCEGAIDRIEVIEDDPRYLRITGWLIDPSSRSSPGRIEIVDPSNTVVGIAIGRRPRDSTGATSPKGPTAGFAGYLRVGEVTTVTLRGERPDCLLSGVRLPAG